MFDRMRVQRCDWVTKLGSMASLSAAKATTFEHYLGVVIQIMIDF
ncbi:hypothetical protein ACP70R_003306 [Stipagrostis hirtigluma subsp. patula]